MNTATCMVCGRLNCKGISYLFSGDGVMMRSIINAMAPSPVTLHAVPKLSIAMYRDIIRA